MMNKQTHWKRKSKIQIQTADPGKAVCFCIGLLTLFLFSPLFSGVNNIGSWFGMGLGILVIVYAIFREGFHACLRLLWKKTFFRVLLSAAGAVLAAVVILILLIIGKMIARASHTDVPDSATVIVLGCRVKGSEPSTALRQRLDAAYEYLCAHENAACILSGGQGHDEEISEAECMRRYLVQKGIAEDRLLMEEMSTSTAENLRYSAELIRLYGLSDHVAIVTQSYHQCRASMWAEDADLIPYAINAGATFRSYPTSFLRDFLGVAHKVVFG